MFLTSALCALTVLLGAVGILALPWDPRDQDAAGRSVRLGWRFVRARLGRNQR